MQDKTIYSALSLAGVTPLVASGLLAANGTNSIATLGSIDRIALSYGFGILCFLTGIHWATQLYGKARLPANLFVVSNVVFLVAWIAYLYANLRTAMLVQLAAFAVLLLIDFRIMRDGSISRHYFRIRSVATGLACGSLILLVLP